jgi:hypothetical protein
MESCHASENPVIAVRLPPEIYARIEAAAKVEGRSLSNFVRQILVEKVQRAGVVGLPRTDAGRAVEVPNSGNTVRRTKKGVPLRARPRG